MEFSSLRPKQATASQSRRDMAMRATFVSLARRGLTSNNSTTNDNNNNNNNTNNIVNNNITNTSDNLTIYRLNSSPSSPVHNTLSTPPFPPSQSRPPLQSRDHNASIMFRGPQKGTPLGKSSNATGNMAYEKQVPVRPVLPTLSAAATKAGSKTPLTPRVAGARVPLSTTPSRRGAAHDSHLTPTNNSVSAGLAHNVTPRSGKRSSRIESPGNTPTGTPQAPQVAAEPRIAHYDAMAGISTDHNRGPSVFSPPASDVGSQVSQFRAATDSKFFFASDAKAVPPVAKQPSRPQLQSKPSSFLYANGNTIPTPVSSGGSQVGSTIDDRSQSKFFHANGAPNVRSSAGYFLPPGSTVSASSPRLAQSPVITTPVRPPSPIKQTPSTSNLKAKPALPTNSLPTRPGQLGRGQSVQDLRSTRSVSIEVPPRLVSHDTAPILGPNEHKRRVSNGPPSAVPILPSTPMLSPRLMSSNPGPRSDDGSVEDNKRLSISSISMSDVQSPTKSGSSLEQMNELAAIARRERKVLDLEIYNSSLTSVNRTLERQLRKQNAELRRYRRLSRSGRLTIAAPGSRPSTATLSEDGQPLSDMSEEDEEEDETSDEESETSEEFDEGALSADAIAEHDAKHRRKDEKRLQLDLTKHQQLLIDSQKMNQSLKRCLGLTEELINDGRKALAYKVKVSDVELGGRVLDPDEVEDDDDDERIRIKASADTTLGYQAWGGEGRDDRDSGIEVDRMFSDMTSELSTAPSYLSTNPSGAD